MFYLVKNEIIRQKININKMFIRKSEIIYCFLGSLQISSRFEEKSKTGLTFYIWKYELKCGNEHLP